MKSSLFEKSSGEPIPVRCDIDILDAHRGELFGKVNAYMGNDIVGYVQFSEAGNPYAEGLREGDEVPSEIWIKYRMGKRRPAPPWHRHRHVQEAD